MSEIADLRKQGKLNEAQELGEDLLQTSPGDIWVKRANAWVYIDFLKSYNEIATIDTFNQYFDKIDGLELPEDDIMINDAIVWKLVKMLFNILRENSFDRRQFFQFTDRIIATNYTKPSEQHSAFLNAIVKAYDKYTNFLDFIEWWNLDNLHDKDFEKWEYEGKAIISLAERTYNAVSKTHLEGVIDPADPDPFSPNRVMNKEAIESFVFKLDDLISEHPDYVWPPYYRVKLLLAIGSEQEMVKLLLPFARTHSKDFWLWDLMADLFDDDPEMQLACYCKSVSCNTKDEFLVRVRKDNEWPILQQLLNWQEDDWYKNSEITKNNIALYNEYKVIAEKILTSDIKPDVGVIIGLNEEKSIAHIRVSKEVTSHFKYYKNNPPKPGDVFEFKLQLIEGKNNSYYKVVDVDKTNSKPDPGIYKKFDGMIRLKKDKNNNTFGFVEDVFIPPPVIDNYISTIIDDQDVIVTAVLDYNNGKDEWGWKAVLLH